MTLESLLSQQGPMSARDLADLLKSPLEAIYERLVRLEALGIVGTIPIPKTGGHKVEWRML